MTLATKVTVLRLVLVPVFAFLAIAYSQSVKLGEPNELLRWCALGVFTAAAISDGIDGWIARKFNQFSELGAFLDPIADKTLVATAIIILAVFEWGPDGWSIPIWFASLVVFRDAFILAGIRFLYSKKLKVKIAPHWSGKICTFSLFVVIGWAMLKIIPVQPAAPCAVAAIFVVWSLLEYIRQGLRILKNQA